MTPLSGRSWCSGAQAETGAMALSDATAIPVWLRRVGLVLGLPARWLLRVRSRIEVRVRWSPCIRAGDVTTSVDTTLVEVLHALTPLHDRETLNRRTRTKHRTLFLCRLQGHLDCLRELRHHVLRRRRLHREPLYTFRFSSCFLQKTEVTRTQPGMRPRPPRREPTPSAPLRPNSTATRPKGSSREGISAKSAPLNKYGGSAVNSGFEYTRSGYISMRRASFSAAKRP